ncbi:MAG: asparaginase [Acidobacteria bacterium]|nr:asparaginase [Acidobacteriota bacterium]
MIRASLVSLLLTVVVAATPAAGGAQPASTPAAATAATTDAQSGPKPRVRLFATGGTISNRTGKRLTDAELLASMPGLDRYARAESEQFANVASSQLTLSQFLDLSRRINAAFAAEADLAGAVVTSGTDTLEELAYFLHLTVRDERPVVVVGSMRNPSTLGYEGAANLLEGFRVAADPQSRGLGTLVVLNDEINSARDVTKTDALRLHTFQSRTVGVLGVVDADRVVYYRHPLKRRGARVEFDVQAITTLPRVDIVMVYQDAPGDLIKAAVDAGARGLVVATAGAGATSGTQGDGLDYARSKQVLIVNGTRTGSGRIASRRGAAIPPAFAQRAATTVSAEDLAPVKARLLLMLALTRTTSRDEIQRMFEEY